MTRLNLIGLVELLCLTPAARAAEVDVAAGTSLQGAIDAAPAGSTLRVAAGVYREPVTVDKPLTIDGAGSADGTVVEAVATQRKHTDAEKLAFATKLDEVTDENQLAPLLRGYMAPRYAATVTIRSAGVTLRHLAVQSATSTFDAGGVEALVRVDGGAGVRLDDCRLHGPARDGVVIANGATVEIGHSLVAGVWGTGVAVGRGATLRLTDSDVRNCYYAGVTLAGGDGSTVERCRISGSAWHGVRYDDGAPTIAGNLIFGNARSGVYASGRTRATVRGNVFWRNGMDAVSCWGENADVVDRNTVVGNLREGVMVCGDARPTLSNNVFADNPVAVACTRVNTRNGPVGDPQPTLTANRFWHNADDLKRLGDSAPLPDGNEQADPRFATADKHDYAVPADATAGAAAVLAVESPWPVTAAERQMVPDGDTRDAGKWHKPRGVR